jgi:phosphoribosylformylglycinamidine synthase subunit PurQ / glutaminase
MKVAVLKFPGSNCDQDAYFALRDDLGLATAYVWHEETSLAGFDAVFIPGGFSYGDYLRCGAMASRAPIMAEVHRFAKEGRPVIGACNGFQILCEAGLLPGALMLNAAEKFICQNVRLEAVNRTSIWTRGVDRVIEIPIAHGEGRFEADADTIARMEDEDLIAFRYLENPNGSLNNIAGALNKQGNVLGLMPHPERATRSLLGSEDGLTILRALTFVAA